MAMNVQGAKVGLTVALVVACFVGRATMFPTEVALTEAWPIVALAILQLVGITQENRSKKVFAASLILCLSASVFLWPNDRVVAATLGTHLLLLAILLTGFAFHDRLALWLRIIGAILLPAFGLGMVILNLVGAMSFASATVYALALALISLFYWRAKNHRLYLHSALVCLGLSILICLFAAQAPINVALSEQIGTALFAGVVCFALAVLISSLKAGLWKVISEECCGTVHALQTQLRLSASAIKPDLQNGPT